MFRLMQVLTKPFHRYLTDVTLSICKGTGPQWEVTNTMRLCALQNDRSRPKLETFRVWIWEALGSVGTQFVVTPAASSQAHPHAQSSSNSLWRCSSKMMSRLVQDPKSARSLGLQSRLSTGSMPRTGTLAKLTFVRSNVEEDIFIFYILLMLMFLEVLVERQPDILPSVKCAASRYRALLLQPRTAYLPNPRTNEACRTAYKITDW
ncbi:hypothetical protein V8E55_006699 [Tylopilus felleus]